MTPLNACLQRIRQRLPLAAVALGMALLTACASPAHRAPVEERKAGARSPTPAPAPPPAAPVAVADPTLNAPAKPALPGAENAGKPGYYSVRPGDTLIRIGLDFGQSWRDITRWNNLENANVIEVGQVLRVLPPTADALGVSTRPVLAAGAVETRPLDGRPATAASAAPMAAATEPTSAAAASSAKPPVPGAPAPTVPGRDPDENLSWAWPSSGPVAAGFDEAKTRGLAITGKAGDPVLAAADGRVVYAGSGLRGYGNLVIIKHNATFLSAYAHNQALLVKEDQAVRKGQKIAEMGSSDSDRVQLHFEVRRMGKPIDPARLLPPR